mgnify:CR=1 FL=1
MKFFALLLGLTVAAALLMGAAPGPKARRISTSFRCCNRLRFQRLSCQGSQDHARRPRASAGLSAVGRRTGSAAAPNTSVDDAWLGLLAEPEATAATRSASAPAAIPALRTLRIPFLPFSSP